MKKSVMQSLMVTLFRYEMAGEKVGWTLIELPPHVLAALNSGSKKSFRVKGKMDDYNFQQVATFPMGGGKFCIAFNAAMRKGTGKKCGDSLWLQIELDKSETVISQDLLKCLAEDKISEEKFLSLRKGNQKYFSDWIESAKTITTKSSRIYKTLFALQHNMDYGEMIRHFKANPE